VANLLYKHYARGRDLRNLETIVGREGMSDADKIMLDFADTFEHDFVHQGLKRRSIDQTLDAGIALLKQFSLEVP
jgi:V/A-type H+-transporting ATPase subunit B